MKSLRGSMVVVASLTLVGGCSAESTPAAAPETVTVTDPTSSYSSTSTSTSSTARATATETATATQTATATSGGLPAGVGEYADAFVRAWGIGDRPDASRYATVDAVRDLFGQDARGGSSWTRQDSTDQGTRTQ